MVQRTKFVEDNLRESTPSNINHVAPFLFAIDSRQNGSEFYFYGYLFSNYGYFSNGLPSDTERLGGRDKVL